MVDLLTAIGPYIPLVRTLLVVIVVWIGLGFLHSRIKTYLIKNVRQKKQLHNIKIFSRIISYAFFTLLLIVAILTYSNNLSGIGLWIGFLSASLGWALQKPITGIASWMMMVVYKPFRIGDRIVIGGVKGDVDDIDLVHIHLKEIGGTVASEESSKRIVLIPNSMMFDQNITNYTGQSDFVLDEVQFTVTFESSTEEAKRISMQTATQFTKLVIEKTGQKPYTRVFFVSGGMSVRVRYMSPATNLQEISSNISEAIYNRIRKSRSVELAYPITKVLFRRDIHIPEHDVGEGREFEASDAEEAVG